VNVAEKIKPEIKQQIANLSVEVQVLEALLKERQSILQNMGNQLIKQLTDNPALYVLEMNPGKNVWELKLKPSIVIPAINMPLKKPMVRN